MIDSTNPRIMADNIQALANGGGGSDLPDVTIQDAGKALLVNNEGKWSAANLPSGVNLDYTKTPINTGIKFNGKDIYRVLIPLGESGTSTISMSTTFVIPSDVGEIVDVKLQFHNNQYSYFSTGYARKDGNSLIVNVLGANFSNVDSASCFLMLDYVK